MEPYTFIFCLGFAGLVLMAVLGVAGGHGAHGHGAHHGHAQGFHLHSTGHHASLHGQVAQHHHSAPSAHSHAHSHSPAAQHTHAPSTGARLLTWMSPRVLFAIALGGGATGLLLAPYVSSEVMRAGGALLGGIGLEKGVVSPLWNGLMRFESKPARTLESAVFEEATALTNFDSDGCGLVVIDLDGHEMRVLARLNSSQRGQQVSAGERLMIEEVDATRGQCHVAKLGS